MQRPATKARADVEDLQRLETGWPSPGPSISAAMVAIDSAAIVVWLSRR